MVRVDSYVKCDVGQIVHVFHLLYHLDVDRARIDEGPAVLVGHVGGVLRLALRVVRGRVAQPARAHGSHP